MKHAKCVVDAKDFQQALKKVLQAAAKKSDYAPLREALVVFDSGLCTLVCTNLDQWCMASIPAVGEPCAFVLTGSQNLLTACKYFSGDMRLSYDEDEPKEGMPTKVDPDGTLTICCGGKELRQRVTTAEDFPTIPEEDEPTAAYSVAPAALYERFQRIKYALSDNDSRPCSCCVKFFDSRIGAVDGYRLALSQDETLRVDQPFYIPPGAMKLLPAFDGEICTLTVEKHYAAFDSGAVRVITHVPEGEGLNFDAAIPKTCGEEHTVDIADFMSGLQYLGEFVRDQDRDIIRFDGGTLSMRNVNGDYSTRLNLAEVPQTVIGFRGYYMLDGLKQFKAKKRSTVTMQMTAPTSPIVLRDDTDLALVLPQRMRDAA